MSYLWQDKSNSDDSNNSATAVSKNNHTKKNYHKMCVDLVPTTQTYTNESSRWGTFPKWDSEIEAAISPHEFHCITDIESSGQSERDDKHNLLLSVSVNDITGRG